MPAAEQLTGPDAYHGEGPVWLGRAGLAWVDMLAGDVLTLDAGTSSVTRWHVGSVAAVVRPRSRGGVVIATEREFVLADALGGPLRGLGEVFSDKGIRFNEGGCDPAGNLVVGTMAYDGGTGRGTVYRLGADLRIDWVMSGVTVSNGLAWSPNGELAYYADSPTGRVDVFDWTAGSGLTGRRPFLTIDPADGSPDGLCADADGGVWVALWGGSAVRHYDAAGTLQRVVDLPVPKVTACTFGGDGLDQLFITTSRENEPVGEHPTAGALFRFDPGVRGLAARPFGG